MKYVFIIICILVLSSIVYCKKPETPPQAVAVSEQTNQDCPAGLYLFAKLGECKEDEKGNYKLINFIMGIYLKSFWL